MLDKMLKTTNKKDEEVCETSKKEGFFYSFEHPETKNVYMVSTKDTIFNYKNYYLKIGDEKTIVTMPEHFKSLDDISTITNTIIELESCIKTKYDYIFDKYTKKFFYKIENMGVEYCNFLVLWPHQRIAQAMINENIVINFNGVSNTVDLFESFKLHTGDYENKDDDFEISVNKDFEDFLNEDFSKNPISSYYNQHHRRESRLEGNVRQNEFDLFFEVYKPILNDIHLNIHKYLKTEKAIRRNILGFFNDTIENWDMGKIYDLYLYNILKEYDFIDDANGLEDIDPDILKFEDILVYLDFLKDNVEFNRYKDEYENDEKLKRLFFSFNHSIKPVTQPLATQVEVSSGLKKRERESTHLQVNNNKVNLSPEMRRKMVRKC